MAHRPKVRWHETANAWRSDVGDYGKPGAGGRARRTPVYFREIPNTPKGKRQAEEALEAYLRDRERREAEANAMASEPVVWPGLVRPYLEMWQARVDEGKGSAKTLRSHRERLKRWLEFRDTATRLARSLTEKDGEDFLGHLEAQGLGPTRIDGILRSVHACLNWGAAKVRGREPGRILPGGNPFAAIKPGGARRTHRKLFDKADMAAFLRAARAHIGDGRPPQRDGRRCLGCKRADRRVERPCRRSHAPRAVYYRAVTVLCRLAWHQIVRPDELCRATWGEVEAPDGRAVPGWEPRASRDDKGQWWGLIRLAGKTTRKTGRMRLIPVPPALARSIERLKAAGLHETWIFPRLGRGETSAGRWTVEGLARPVRLWRRAAGLPEDFVLYSLRHRGYTKAVGGGLTADQAGMIGGTSGEVVRGVYLQEDLDALFEHATAARKAGRSGGKAGE